MNGLPLGMVFGLVLSFLEELQSLIRLPDFSIERRWHGVYAKHPTDHVFMAEPQPNCKIITATGSAGNRASKLALRPDTLVN